jgi:hypothetical protein
MFAFQKIKSAHFASQSQTLVVATDSNIFILNFLTLSIVWSLDVTPKAVAIGTLRFACFLFYLFISYFFFFRRYFNSIIVE